MFLVAGCERGCRAAALTPLGPCTLACEKQKKIPTPKEIAKFLIAAPARIDTQIPTATAIMALNHLLFESPVGFAIFDVRHQADSIGLELPEVKESMKHLDRFGKMVQLRSFTPWK